MTEAAERREHVTKRMLVALCVALILVLALTIYGFLDVKYHLSDIYVWRAIETAVHLAVGALLVFAVIEWPHFQDTVGSHITRVMTEQIDKTVLGEDKLTSSDYLRRRFKTDVLQKCRHASTEAIAGRALDQEERDLLEKHLYSALDGQQRREWKIYRRYEYHTLPTGRCFKLREVVSYKCCNSRKDTWHLPMRIRMDKIEGVAPDTLMTLEHVRVGGRDVAATLEVSPDTDSVVFAAALTVPYAHGMQVEIASTKYLKLEDIWTTFFIQPTYGFEVLVDYPPDLTPKLFMFGFGVDDPQKPPELPSIAGGGQSAWGHREWMFNNQGWMMVWK